jgi:hypothetical protein
VNKAGRCARCLRTDAMASTQQETRGGMLCTAPVHVYTYTWTGAMPGTGRRSTHTHERALPRQQHSVQGRQGHKDASSVQKG